MNEEPRIAVFVDFENLALGVRDALHAMDAGLKLQGRIGPVT